MSSVYVYNSSSATQTEILEFSPPDGCIQLHPKALAGTGNCDNIMGNYFVHTSVIRTVTGSTQSVTNLKGLLQLIEQVENPNGSDTSFWRVLGGPMFEIFKDVCKTSNVSQYYNPYQFASNIRYFREHMCQGLVMATNRTNYCPQRNRTCPRLETFAFRDSLVYSTQQLYSGCQANVTNADTGALSQILNSYVPSQIFDISVTGQCTLSEVLESPEHCGLIDYSMQPQPMASVDSSGSAGVTLFPPLSNDALHDICQSNPTSMSGGCCSRLSSADRQTQTTQDNQAIQLSTTTIIAIVVGSSIAIALLSYLGVYIYRRGQRSSQKLARAKHDKDAIELQLAQEIVRPVTSTTFSTKWRVRLTYKARREDEIDLNAGDLVVLLSVFNDGWGHGLNENTQQVGTLPIAALEITEDEVTRYMLRKSEDTSMKDESLLVKKEATYRI
ncbi:uncharacterized protein BJ171DRAFT_498760 [Polychytrium aggregatum]|uniref:uncharacterized protein n=1 Tax=Polychytrium aggregatum TaxID=110093 RepID=UPI0022FE6C9A|nr:uncharacterized protein BJ171DRAFT_498760 [Polychytrium aggregatum]KAI9206118.1 hypothetical protein BJ171DRAFT_498760 [Polychytrium aggregatum]